MPRIQILDERKYPLPIKETKEDAALPYYRWEHRATLGRRGRAFLVFLDNGIIVNDTFMTEPSIYIEEITTGSLKRIEEEDLFKELHIFSHEIGFLEIQMPIKKGKA